MVVSVLFLILLLIIQVWDLAKCSTGAEGGLKLTLTGHIHTVRGLAISKRHPYMFSAGEDKKVMFGSFAAQICLA